MAVHCLRTGFIRRFNKRNAALTTCVPKLFLTRKSCTVQPLFEEGMFYTGVSLIEYGDYENEMVAQRCFNSRTSPCS